MKESAQSPENKSRANASESQSPQVTTTGLFEDNRPDSSRVKALQLKVNGSLDHHQNNAASSSIPIQKMLRVTGPAQTASFNRAFEIFLASLAKSSDERVQHYMAFVNSGDNKHDLVFRTIPKEAKKPGDKGELHGVTNITFSGTQEDIIEHMFKQNLDPESRIDDIMGMVDMVKVMAGVDVMIDIVVGESMTEPILLETLNHEFSVHAIKWSDFIYSVYNKKNVAQTLKQRIQDMPNDHKEFGRNQNQLYEEIREKMMHAIDTGDEQELKSASKLAPGSAAELRRISRDAIEQHKPHEDIRRELDILIQQTDSLAIDTTPFLPKARRQPAKQSKKGKCPCYITTACTQAQGLPDNCDELQTLRKFRDEYLLLQPNGPELVDIYYEHSPYIVTRIYWQEEEEEYWNLLYQIIKICVLHIKKGNNKKAFDIYCEMVMKMKNTFAANLKIDMGRLLMNNKEPEKKAH